MIDLYERNIDYIRISITDKCNLRCKYCIPEEDITSTLNNEILTFDEIIKICISASKLGIKKVKITGGEPLLRADVTDLIKSIKSIPLIENVTLTTNGIFLSDKVRDLKESGIDSINVSLDTLNKNKFKDITRRDGFDKVIDGIKRSIKLGIKIKINCVPIRNFNYDEINDIAAIAKDNNIDVRFIEMMPIGIGNLFNSISNKEILEIIEKNFGEFKIWSRGLQAENKKKDLKNFSDNGPATYYQNDNFKGRIGLISAVSNEFCPNCNRIRITSDGFLKPCLCYSDGIDLKALIRNGTSEEELTLSIKNGILNKPEKHGFNKLSKSDNLEVKSMSQIGG
ncbi:GTP 3',8-cyclase MoaA [Clostridium beijerinckii]|nr:GTP 3',8-cyclase MoaA [Clostridium beijerinckii]